MDPDFEYGAVTYKGVKVPTAVKTFAEEEAPGEFEQGYIHGFKLGVGAALSHSASPATWPAARTYASGNEEPYRYEVLTNADGMILKYGKYGLERGNPFESWWWTNQENPSWGSWSYWALEYGPWQVISVNL